jgi:cysteine desulfurase/selenocysteine lyase
MDPERYRPDFPILQSLHNDLPIIYFDNACMTLKPRQVLDAICHYYNDMPICAGRSVHRLGTQLTLQIDETRQKMADFLNAGSPDEIVFTKNTTEGINLVACGLELGEGDVVITTDKEHNSNLVPWLSLAGRKGIVHEAVPTGDDGMLDMDAYDDILSRHRGRVRLVSMTHTSNLDGVTIPAKDIISRAHDAGALALLDAAQSVPHTKTDVRALDVDFLALSVHKMAGPTGVGVLYGKYDLLEGLGPFISGGSTVASTTLTEALFLPPPKKFEAGLQNYGGLVGAAAAVDYLQDVGMDEIHSHEQRLNRLATDLLKDLPGISILGPPDPALRSGILGFNLKGVDPHDIAMIMDETKNVLIRSGLHCVHAWFHRHDVDGSARASFYLYNTEDEVKVFAEQLEKINESFST